MDNNHKCSLSILSNNAALVSIKPRHKISYRYKTFYRCVSHYIHMVRYFKPLFVIILMITAYSL